MATTKVITDLTEFNPGNPDYVLNATNAVTVINAGGNQYNFNGVYGKFGLRIGTTVLTGVPSGHPIAIINNGKTSQISYTGTSSAGTATGPDGNTYTFYYGDITITVAADFGTVSYYCQIHGYMGGLNNFVSVYSEAGLRMPTGGAFSGTPAEGMMRNDTTQASEGSASTMQHYTGDNVWKNFVNVAPVPYSVKYLSVAGGGGGQSGGGGGGGLRGSDETGGGGSTTSLSLTPGTVYTITIGGGAIGGNTGGTTTGTGYSQGEPTKITGSDISTIESTGGGTGGTTSGFVFPSTRWGQDGGSGGGGGRNHNQNGSATSPTQGYNGGSGTQTGSLGGGGGGGAGAVGQNGATSTSNPGANGGAGLSSSITGVPYAGGGGAAGENQSAAGTGGTGGGADGGTGNSGIGDNAPANFGGGGGGGYNVSAHGAGGNGGSGVFILSVPTASYSGTTSGSPTITTSGGNTIMTFNGSGSYTA